MLGLQWDEVCLAVLKNTQDPLCQEKEDKHVVHDFIEALHPRIAIWEAGCICTQKEHAKNDGSHAGGLETIAVDDSIQHRSLQPRCLPLQQGRLLHSSRHTAGQNQEPVTLADEHLVLRIREDSEQFHQGINVLWRAEERLLVTDWKLQCFGLLQTLLLGKSMPVQGNQWPLRPAKCLRGFHDASPVQGRVRRGLCPHLCRAEAAAPLVPIEGLDSHEV
mmetsp:Transcript_74983/g.175861  ORF Transcript_74983/g.175861 Transcript_74983/m.175861 type:complete len:219 (-) Transcript_74983:212-868(-)